MKKVYIVIPTARNLDFLRFWKNEFAAYNLIIVEDKPHKETHWPGAPFSLVHHYSWEDIQKDFGSQEWIFSRHNAGIRSYGFWKAYTMGADIIITLDDDCFPAENRFVEKHINNLLSKAPDSWFSTFPHPDYMFTRGYPYTIRGKHRVVMSHGLWSNKMDMDAITQLRIGPVNVRPYPLMRQFVPFGYFFPMSSMNLAFTRDIVPLMYFPLMGESPEGKRWGYDRYDDIWAGVFVKRTLDHLGLAVVNGSPFVEHRKASDPNKNRLKERSGMKTNEWLWERVRGVALHGQDPVSCYKELIKNMELPSDEYFTKLRLAMRSWIALFR